MKTRRRRPRRRPRVEKSPPRRTSRSWTTSARTTSFRRRSRFETLRDPLRSARKTTTTNRGPRRTRNESRLGPRRVPSALGARRHGARRSAALTAEIGGDGIGRRRRRRTAFQRQTQEVHARSVLVALEEERGWAGAAISRFQAAARKIHAAGRFGGASFAASGSESAFGEEPGVSLSLLDELNAEPDVASVAKAETSANDTELTRRHRSAVDEAVASLKNNAMFSETLGSFETTRALASTLEAALFERTSDVELAWETKAAAMRAEIERLTRSNEDAAEAMAMMSDERRIRRGARAGSPRRRARKTRERVKRAKRAKRAKRVKRAKRGPPTTSRKRPPRRRASERSARDASPNQSIRSIRMLRMTLRRETRFTRRR